MSQTNYQTVFEEIQAGRSEAALSLLSPMLTAEPEQPQLWYCKALALVSLNQWDEAIAAAETALNLNPDLAAAHRLIAKAQAELGQAELAISSKACGAMAAYKQTG